MAALVEVPIAPAPLDRFVPIIGSEAVARAARAAERLRASNVHRTIWNVNSTRAGGGVAEMLRSLLAYARGAGVDTRWLVISGGTEFFRVTKRLHNALHGEQGDGSPLGDPERRLYESVLAANASPLLQTVQPDDVVILHDPQTAGLAPALLARGVGVIWRCHIGTDPQNPQTALGWSFLLPYLLQVKACVFSREPYVPEALPPERVSIITPSIDPFSAKNRDMDEAQVRAILGWTGLVQGDGRSARPQFTRDDGSIGTMSHCADVVGLGPPPRWESRLVVQVSRWDDLKDPVGVMLGFASAAANGLPADVELVLAGPTVRSVADDPDGPRVFNAVLEEFRGLPHAIRRRVHLANLPMADIEENGAIVNALQRHATVVVQKSLREGFGLTVTEAMWKGRAVVASKVGGIQDQIEDGSSGLLLDDPRDLTAYGRALVRVLTTAGMADALGRRARQRVIERFLGVRHLLQYADIIERLDRDRASAGALESSPER